MFLSSTQILEDQINALAGKIRLEKQTIINALRVFSEAQTYDVKDNGGSVSNYKYYLYPFKGLTHVSQKLHADLAKYLAMMVPKDTEAILTIEADGIALASFVGAALELPVFICKSFHYNEPCVSFVQQAGYHQRTMYMPKIIQGKKIALIDCLLSTGGTIQTMISTALSLPNTSVSSVLCLANKDNYKQQSDMISDIPYHYLLNTRVNEENKVEAVVSKMFKKIFWHGIDEQFYELAKNYSILSNFSKNGYQVGAIIVAADNFEIAAWGYRRGHIHAEQDAINMLKSNYPDWQKREYSLYTTLEPCVHRNGDGYTPCADLINEIPQIRWVIIGRKDSINEKINGAGIEKLNQKKHIRFIEKNEILRAKEEVPHFSPQNII